MFLSTHLRHNITFHVMKVATEVLITVLLIDKWLPGNSWKMKVRMITRLHWKWMTWECSHTFYLILIWDSNLIGKIQGYARWRTALPAVCPPATWCLLLRTSLSTPRTPLTSCSQMEVSAYHLLLRSIFHPLLPPHSFFQVKGPPIINSEQPHP